MTRTPDVSDLTRQELRLVYYDFTVRGLGEAPLIQAVLQRWFELGALSAAEVRRWFDALEWREAGGFLPGWPAPEAMPPSEWAEHAHGEADLLSFESWRRDRRRKSA
jgi:hypothetical protein